MITNDEMRRLWEWCGLRQERASNEEIHWFDPEGVIASPTNDKSLPVLSLDNLFKWAIPRTPHLILSHRITIPNLDIGRAQRFIPHSKLNPDGSMEWWEASLPGVEAKADNPAEAIARAILKLMEAK